jgi:hypothetical protein
MQVADLSFEENSELHYDKTIEGEACQAIATRLVRMLESWLDAAEAYFEPSSFVTALQNCITTSRTVTFIIQSNKDVIPDFDIWYPKQQEKMRASPIMEWAKNSRNIIEKQRDLAPSSEIRLSIIASYLGEAVSEWVPNSLFLSVSTLLKLIPRQHLTPHIVTNGTLLVERRWVESGLPNMEVLEALAEVYTILSEIVVSAHAQLGQPVPDVIKQIRPREMAPMTNDRAMYVSIRHGHCWGTRKFFIEPAQDPKRIVRRYGNPVELPPNAEIGQAAKALLGRAERRLARDGHHATMLTFRKGGANLGVVGLEFPDQGSKYVLMRELADLAVAENVDTVFLIAEVWMSFGKNVPPNGMASEDPQRQEALVVSAANKVGARLNLSRPFKRGMINKNRVKLAGSVIHDTIETFMLLPFQLRWGCLDPQAAQREEEHFARLGREIPRWTLT